MMGGGGRQTFSGCEDTVILDLVSKVHVVPVFWYFVVCDIQLYTYVYVVIYWIPDSIQNLRAPVCASRRQIGTESELFVRVLLEFLRAWPLHQHAPCSHEQHLTVFRTLNTSSIVHTMKNETNQNTVRAILKDIY